MLKKHDKILVCVSGGPDSVALLYLLNSLKKEFNLKLHIAHLNHMMRKQDAEKDALFVKKIAKRLKIPITIDKKDVPAFIRQTKASPEEAARIIRYNFFAEVAKKVKANKIATGHTLDDQAETVLMRLIKGAGTEGLRGIPPKRRLNNLTIIRPLIETQRTEILKFLKTKRIKPRLDTSNLKTFYFRNKIRKELIPLLERYNPNIKQTLSRMAQVLDDDYGYLEKLKEDAFKKSCQVKDTDIQINTNRFTKLPVSLQKGVLRKAIKLIKGDLQKITYQHCDELYRLINERKTGSVVDLPQKIKAVKKQHKIIFTLNPKPKTLHLTPISKVLNMPGVTKIPALKKSIEAKILKGPIKIKKVRSKNTEYVDFDKIDLPIIVRTKRPGDRIRPLGMRGYKKLQDIFVDEKIPPYKRNRILILETGGRIIWVLGVRISDDVKLTKNTKHIVKLIVK